MKRVMVLAILISLLICGSALAQATQPVNSGWMQIPVSGAVCARGTPYSFFVHSGDPSKLMVYFQGGGACWSAETCKPGGTFDNSVDAHELDQYKGIFDFANPQNPVADYSMVVVAYCTGDVHTGSGEQSFTLGDTSFSIDFHGFENAQAVLQWVYQNYPDPNSLIVTGSSAGAYGAIFHAPYLLDHYPEAQAVVLGDAGVGVVPPDWGGFSGWSTTSNAFQGENYGGITAGAELTNRLYTAAATAFPQAVIAEYTSHNDFVQRGFYTLQGGKIADWSAGAESSFTQLDQLANFRSYLGWGGNHTILPLPDFYQMQVNGVAFRDWFAALIDGKVVEDVQCTDCTNSELVSQP